MPDGTISGHDHLRKWIETVSISVSVLAMAAAVWYATLLSQHAADKNLAPLVQNANGTITRFNQTLDFVNRPCDSHDKNGKALKDGPLCQLQKLETEVRGIAIDTRGQVKQTGVLLNASVASLTNVSDKVGDEVVALKGTTNAATTLLQTSNTAVGQLNDKQNGLLAVLTTFNQTGKNLNDILVAKATKRMLDNFAATSDNVSVTTKQLSLAATDFETRFHLLLNPPKCKTAGCRIGRGFVAGLKEGPALGQSAYWTYRLFDQAIPVKIVP